MASTHDQPLLTHPEAVDTKDSLSFETVSTKKELEAVKNALLRILQEENPLPGSEHELRKAELSRRLSHGSDSENSDVHLKNGENGMDSKDLMLLSKLLNQVRHFNMEQKQDDLSTGESSPRGFEKPHRYSKHSHVEEESVLSRSEKMMENIVGVATAAAEAAKAAAVAAAKNVEIMESLLGNSKKLKIHHGKHSERCQSETSQDDNSDASSMDERAKDFVKRVEKQNKVTHWMLGIMMVTTIIWRFKVLSMALGLKNSITNPFQAIGGIFDGFVGSNREEPKPFEKARALLQDRGNHVNEKMGKASSDDPNVAEGLGRSLDNILNGGPLSNGDNGSEHSTH